MSDPNNAEHLDEDLIGEEYPPEQPLGVNEDPDAMDSVAERSRRERPDNLGEDVGRVGQLVDAGDEINLDLEADAVASEVAPRLRRDQMDPSDPTRGDWSVQDREEVMPAEEAAMHLTDPPPMGDGDGYVDA